MGMREEGIVYDGRMFQHQENPFSKIDMHQSKRNCSKIGAFQ